MKDEVRAALAKRIYDTAHITGDFLLRSGARSTEYFDKYLFEADPDLLKHIALGLAPLVPKDVDALAGLEMGGIPIATMLSQLTGLPVLFVRKKAKDYGTCKIAEGGQVEGRRLLLVEDGRGDSRRGQGAARGRRGTGTGGLRDRSPVGWTGEFAQGRTGIEAALYHGGVEAGRRGVG
jgi:hypothetical protein